MSFRSLESKPSLANLNQIRVPESSSGTSRKYISQISESLKKWGLNFSLPIVCLTDDENVYQILTGLPIYEAAVDSGIESIWVFLVAAERQSAEEVLEQVYLQSKLNEGVVDSEEVENFIKFISTSNVAELVRIPGIKDGYAKMIMSKRPYSSPEDLKKLGAKRSMNWLKAWLTDKSLALLPEPPSP